MNLIGTPDTQLLYIPFQQILLTADRYRFRLLDTAPVEDLAVSLKRSGQTHPIYLEQTGADICVILDGHHRCEAIKSIRDNGGVWEKVLAQIVPSIGFSTLDRFRLIHEKNMNGKNPYGLIERGRFFKCFLDLGLAVQQISAETGFSAHAIEDLAELAPINNELGLMLNHADIEPVFAAMLHRRYEAWRRTPFAHEAPRVAGQLLQHLKNERITMKSWRFLLDFYWPADRPFMS